MRTVVKIVVEGDAPLPSPLINTMVMEAKRRVMEALAKMSEAELVGFVAFDNPDWPSGSPCPKDPGPPTFPSLVAVVKDINAA